MIKTTLLVNINVDLLKFSRIIIAFLKPWSNNYLTKKSRVLGSDHILHFIREAPDSECLLQKVVILMGVFGPLWKDELTKMSVDDIEDKGSCVIFKVPSTKTGPSPGFSIIDEDKIGALQIIKKYMAIREGKATKRLFKL